jgi:hypothetical protein
MLKSLAFPSASEIPVPNAPELAYRYPDRKGLVLSFHGMGGNLARHPTVDDQRLDDIGFSWLMLTDSQRDDVYNAVAKLHTFNESYEDTESGPAPRLGLKRDGQWTLDLVKDNGEVTKVAGSSVRIFEEQPDGKWLAKVHIYNLY